MAAITREVLQDLYYVQDFSEQEIAELLGIGRATVSSYRIKYAFIPKNCPVFPRCPQCGATTRFLRDEGMGFCPVCLVRVNVKGQLVEVEA